MILRVSYNIWMIKLIKTDLYISFLLFLLFFDKYALTTYLLIGSV